MLGRVAGAGIIDLEVTLKCHVTCGRRIGLWGAATLSACVATSNVAAQANATPTHRDTFTGRVTADSGRAVAGATVTITMAPDRTYQQTMTSTDGRYTIVFERGTGDYLVHVAAPGHAIVRKRVTRAGNDSVFVVDIALTPPAGPPQLAPVQVRARKPRPTPGSGFGMLPGPGADERLADGVTSAVSPDLAGNLSAIAAAIPGMTLTPNGVSVGGVAPSQNSVTLNGLGFSGADVPRDAITNIRVSSSTYDPARGWFGGIEQQVEMVPDVVASIRSGHLTLDAPALQYTDPVSRALGSRFTGVDVGVGGADHIYRDELAYDYGLTAKRRTDSPASLLTASPGVLTATGISSDSVARLRAILPTTGLAALAPASDLTQTTDHLTFIGGVGKAPTNWTTFQPERTVWTFTTAANLERQTAMGVLPTALPTTRRTNTAGSLALQAYLMHYVRDNALFEGETGLSVTRQRTRPMLELPGASVVLLSTPDGSDAPSLATVGVAGSPLSGSTSSQWTWETRGEYKLYPTAHPTHRLKLTADARVDGARDATDPSLGTFSFLSLDDLATGKAASFTRTLGTPTSTAHVANAFVALGDWWRVSDRFDLLYGLRAEGTHYLDAPAANSTVRTAFGFRTAQVPGEVALSPRVGFTWTHHESQAGGFSGGSLGRFYNLPTGTLRGGIGEFRSFMGPQLIENARISTGLPSSAIVLTCVGAGVPAVDWAAFASDAGTIPTQCASGAPSAFTDASPSVELFDPSYRAPRSWRGNLNYTSRLGRVIYAVDALYSLSLDQPGRVDLNFANAPQFTTATEGRTIFAPASDIVPASGIVAPGAARSIAAFGHVFDAVSSNRSVGRQMTITVKPNIEFIKRWYASASYTLASSRALMSGFDGTTFGSPLVREWGRGNFDVRHQFVLQGGYATRHYAFTLFAHAQSGLPFTPLVGSDVNGDGLVNDRAFIYAPQAMSDVQLATGMQSLLASAPASVRDCLERQLGHAAARNSCDGPWTAMLNAQVGYHGRLPLGGGRMGSISLFFNNPLGGLDQLVHGSDNLHGWGTLAAPDPVLYTVRGFDPATRQFQYAVNSRFGSSRPTVLTARAPFRVTLDVSVDLSADSYLGFVNRWVRPGRGGFRGPRVPASMIERAYQRVLFDPYAAILDEADSLMLTRAQVDSLHSAQRSYLAQRDSMISAFATYLAGLGDTYSTPEVLRRQRELLDEATDVGHESIRRVLPGLLDPMQLRMLPYPADRMLAAPDNVHGMAVLQR